MSADQKGANSTAVDDDDLELLRKHIEGLLENELKKSRTPLTAEVAAKPLSRHLADIFGGDISRHISIDAVTSPDDRAARRLSLNLIPLTPFGKLILERLRDLDEDNTND